jgi:PAS domain-containing protein
MCEQFNLVALTDETRLALYLRAAEDARGAQRRFERLANCGKEALILHAGGIITDANSVACEMLETTRERLVGAPITKVLAKNSQRLVTLASDAANNSFTRIKIVRNDGALADAFGFHHEFVFPEGPVGVLVLRPYERKGDDDRACSCPGETAMN